MIKLFVHADTAAGQTILDAEDQSVPGVYAVALINDTPTAMLLDAALDGFHTHVAVGVLDNFSFTVRDAQGRLIEPGAEAPEPYTLQSYVVSVSKVSGANAPVPMLSFRQRLEALSDSGTHSPANSTPTHNEPKTKTRKP